MLTPTRRTASIFLSSCVLQIYFEGSHYLVAEMENKNPFG